MKKEEKKMSKDVEYMRCKRGSCRHIWVYHLSMTLYERRPRCPLCKAINPEKVTEEEYNGSWPRGRDEQTEIKFGD